MTAPWYENPELVAERGPNARFQMFTREGNDACAGVIEFVEECVRNGLTRKNLASCVRRGMNGVAKKHDEVWDTEPRNEIIDVVNDRICKPQMWMPLDGEI